MTGSVQRWCETIAVDWAGRDCWQPTDGGTGLTILWSRAEEMRTAILEIATRTNAIICEAPTDQKVQSCHTRATGDSGQRSLGRWGACHRFLRPPRPTPRCKRDESTGPPENGYRGGAPVRARAGRRGSASMRQEWRVRASPLRASAGAMAAARPLPVVT